MDLLYIKRNPIVYRNTGNLRPDRTYINQRNFCLSKKATFSCHGNVESVISTEWYSVPADV